MREAAVVAAADLDPVDPGAAARTAPLRLDVLKAPPRVHHARDPALPCPAVGKPDDGALHGQNPLSLHPALLRPDVEHFVVRFLHLSNESLTLWTKSRVNLR